MEHAFLDKYSNLNSIIHRLSPNIKLIFTFSFIVFIILTPATAILKFFIYFAIIFSIIILSKVPVIYVLKKSLIIFPFVIFVTLFIPFLKEGKIIANYNLVIFHLSITENGLLIFWNCLIKSWLSILIMIILSSTTKFQHILKALEFFKTPRILIILLAFMYRYIFLLIDEAMRLERAYNSRYFGGKVIKQIRVIGNMIGFLFIRTYERGERIYMAMCSRGFEYAEGSADGKSSRDKRT